MSLTDNIVKTALLTLGLTAVAISHAAPQLSLIDTLKTPYKKGTEIISVQAEHQRFITSNSIEGVVGVYSLSSPSKPQLIRYIDLALTSDEQITSVAVHPEFDYMLAAIQAASPLDNGRVEVRDIDSGQLLAQVPSGIGPDAVIIDPTGRFALIPNEAEQFVLDRKTMTYSSPKGSISLLSLDRDPAKITVQQIALPDLDSVEGGVEKKHHRFIERAIDWNQDGKITKKNVDLNGNGTNNDNNVIVGQYQGVDIKAKEKNGEYFLFPLLNNKADVLEPEYAAFSPDGNLVWVVLQENNILLEIDSKTATILRTVGLGITEHLADIDDDDNVDFSATLRALREPDGIAMTKDGRYLVTADEGDTDPKAAKTKKGPTGGGRTISVFDTETGALLGDTGNQIDQATHKAGFYPESRSDNKGSEPEIVTSFMLDGVNYAAAGLERANGVALISLADPSQPQLVDVESLDNQAKAGKVAPEGIAYFYDAVSKQHYLYTANEKQGSISVLNITP